MAHLKLYVRLKAKIKREKKTVKEWTEKTFPNHKYGSIVQMYYKKNPIHGHIKTTIEKYLEEK